MGSVRDYFDIVENYLLNSPIVATHEVRYEEKSMSLGILYGDILLANSYALSFLELVRVDGRNLLLRYRFHLMNEHKEPVFRYDNAPHHKEIHTYPDHKHVFEKEGERILPSKEVNLIDVMEEIYSIFSF